jgi:hypothetical protein
MLEPDQWKAACILNKQKRPSKPSTLNEVLHLIARLGMHRIVDFAAGIRLLRELLAQGTFV